MDVETKERKRTYVLHLKIGIEVFQKNKNSNQPIYSHGNGPYQISFVFQGENGEGCSCIRMFLNVILKGVQLADEMQLYKSFEFGNLD